VTTVVRIQYRIVTSLIILSFLLQVRDYIHVVDLADGHIAALQKLFENSSIG
jgi:hypothetical protein